MVRSLWLFNVLLVLLSSGLLSGLIDSLVDHRSLSVMPQATPTARQPAAEVPKGENPESSVRPRHRPLSDFDIVLQRDPFKRPVANPPKPPVKPIAKRPPPLMRLPTLLGTIFVGEERQAILKDGKREDLYRIGQPVGGGILTKIEVDRVVITRGNHPAEILMKSAIQENRPKAKPAGKGGLSSPPPSRFSRSAQRVAKRR